MIRFVRKALSTATGVVRDAATLPQRLLQLIPGVRTHDRPLWLVEDVVDERPESVLADTDSDTTPRRLSRVPDLAPDDTAEVATDEAPTDEAPTDEAASGPSITLVPDAEVGLAKAVTDAGLTQAAPTADPSPAAMEPARVVDVTDAAPTAVSPSAPVRDGAVAVEERTLAATLEAINGIGPAKRAAILEVFDTAAELRAADEETLAMIDGISPRLAKLVLDAVR